MKNKIFIVTGSSGIAGETIKLLCRRGAKVYYVSRTEKSCEKLFEELKQEGLNADYMTGDLTNPDIAPVLVEKCKKKYGRIDGLFNVAGISGRKFGDGPAHECTEEGWSITIKTNVTTQFRMCRETLKVMLSQEPDEAGLKGTILNMSSVLGMSPEPRYFSTIGYAAAKGAIISMTRSMAAYYAPYSIRINAIAPGLVLTKMSERAVMNPDIVEFMKEKQPLIKNVMTADEVAESALFLLSNQSKLITGEILTVDAGWCIS